MSAEADGETPFAGWAILELMGHRKLGGYVREATLAGGAFLRIDVPSECEGVSASWCPVHGDCTCPRDNEGHAPELCDPRCPLHSEHSDHPASAATQFYSPGSVYCLTPTTEETARALARSTRPAPVSRYELPALRAAPSARRAARVDPDACEHGVPAGEDCEECDPDDGRPDDFTDDEDEPDIGGEGEP